MVAAAHVLPYPVTVAAGALDHLDEVVAQAAPHHRAVAITDDTVFALYGARVSASLSRLAGHTLLSFRLSEAAKTRETWSRITDALLDGRFGRDTTLLAVGGGVVGDLVGFVAATYMRGVPCVQVPTTLLAMVDASIGGKTGVDTRHGKNLVGAFHNPVAVTIDPSVLASLPETHLRGGMAEIIKHGVVADAGYFARVSRFVRDGELGSRDWSAWSDIISRSVEIKADVVSRDEREGGLRKSLNFGHTIGHAIEAHEEYALHHGEAVAIGMVAEARIAWRMGVADRALPDAIETSCRDAGLPTRRSGLDVERLLEFTRSDKKARSGRVEYALPARIGEMAGADTGYGIAVPDDMVREVLTS